MGTVIIILFIHYSMELSSQRVFEGTLLLGDILQTLKQQEQQQTLTLEAEDSVLFMSLGESHWHSKGLENSCNARTHLICPLWHLSDLLVRTPVYLCVYSSPSWEKKKSYSQRTFSTHPHTHTYTCNMEKMLKTQFQEPVWTEVKACTPGLDKPRFNSNSTNSSLGMLLNLPEPQLCYKWKPGL